MTRPMRTFIGYVYIIRYGLNQDMFQRIDVIVYDVVMDKYPMEMKVGAFV